MKLKKAIEILEEQKQKILNPKYPNNQEWVVETTSYIKDFFGFDSVEYSRIAQFKFSVVTLNIETDENVDRLLNQKVKDIVLFLDNCKRTLEVKGLYKNQKANIVSDKTNFELISIIIAISITVFGIGYYFGTEKTNTELFRVQNELNEIKTNVP